MKIKIGVAVALLALGTMALAPSAHAIGPFDFIKGMFVQPTPQLKSVTGTVTITRGDKVITVKAGDPMPTLEAGDKIAVVSGTADIGVGGNTVSAQTGAKVSVDSHQFTVNSGVATYAGHPIIPNATINENTPLVLLIVTPNPAPPAVPLFRLPPPPPPDQQKTVSSPSAP